MRTPKPLSKLAWLMAVLLLIGAINVLEFRSSPEITFSFLYLAPICIATWYFGIRTGLLCAALVGLDWVVHALLGHPRYSQHWFAFWNATLRTSSLVLVAILLDRLRTSIEHERRSARKDPLTGLTNLRGFYECMEVESRWSKRTHEPVTVAYLDLDDFKQVNDRWGHETGNDVLRTITTILTTHLRSIDTAARLGGDEFAVILPRTSAEDARTVLTKLQEALREGMREHQWPVTVSIGLVTYLTLPENVPAILAKADDLMYAVKRQGKNQISQEVMQG